MDLLSTTGTLASAGGRLLGAATAAIAALRPAEKPLHPDGSVLPGWLDRSGGAAVSGVEWLDGAGRDEVLVRLSRAVGLPAPFPDVFGLALRVPVAGGGSGDLLLASTGLGRLTRFTLTAGRSPSSRPLTTLLPYRTPVGPVVLAAVHRQEGLFTLSWACGAGEWHPFAELHVDRASLPTPDAQVSFDPLLNTVPGLENYAWVQRLREPSYRTARRSRS